MPYVRPLDPALGTLGHDAAGRGLLLRPTRASGTSRTPTSTPADPASTDDALEPYGFSEWNDWGDIDGGAWAGLQGRSGDRRSGGAVAARPRPGGRRRPAVVHGGQLRQPARHHELRLRQPVDGAACHRASRTPWRSSRPPTSRCTSTVGRRRCRRASHDDLTGAAPAVREYAEVLDVMFGPVDGDDHWRAGMNFYLNCIRDVDRSIELVLDALEASGQADRHDRRLHRRSRRDGRLARAAPEGQPRLRRELPRAADHPPPRRRRAAHRPTRWRRRSTWRPRCSTFAGVDADAIADRVPGLHGPLAGARRSTGSAVRDGVLTAVESITTLDADFWRAFGDPDVRRRGCSRASCAPTGASGASCAATPTSATPSAGTSRRSNRTARPTSTSLLARQRRRALRPRRPIPTRLTNLAVDPAHARARRRRCRPSSRRSSPPRSAPTPHAWVTEKPLLLGLPRWRGDAG